MLSNTQAPFDFSSADTDVAIEYSATKFSGYVSDFLMSEEVIAICSPQFHLLSRDLKTPVDLDNCTLIHNTVQPDQWTWWKSELGLNTRHTGPNMRVSNRDAAIDAAAAGLGVALAHKPLVNGALLRKRVVSPFDVSVPIEFSYFLVTTDDRALLPRVKAFRNWISSQISFEGSVAQIP